MIGRPTSPAMTEKSDPSMPATAMITLAFSISSTRERSRRTPATPTSGRSVEDTPRYSSVARASSATPVSEVPAVTTATDPSTRRIGFPSERCSVRDRASYPARPGRGDAETSSHCSGESRVTRTSCARASCRQISTICNAVFPCASTTSGKPTRRIRSKSSVKSCCVTRGSYRPGAEKRETGNGKRLEKPVLVRFPFSVFRFPNGLL